MTNVLAALGAAVFGMVITLGAAIADVAANTDFGPWAQVGGTATSVAALAYVAKLLADGRLVAQPISDLIRAAGEREKRLEAVVDRCQDREDSLRLLLINRDRT